MIRQPQRSTQSRSSAASDVYKRQDVHSGGWYHTHVFNSLYLTLQLMVAGLAGFVHALFPMLLPFVAEEVGIQLHALVQARQKRSGSPDYASEGVPYAYQPSRWTIWVDGSSHVQFSGCLLYTSPSPRDRTRYRMPSSA
eukprot:TRINITY_DN18807_c0_g1_i1.p1 TRINITY_DN18807_c0_g1~~TRINITY_DN18807_c0_g1_i1.p1  ORF type:complete len:139 (-),score=48.96 TRINITY_DN18807_c0_g1_i1:37-453(-)